MRSYKIAKFVVTAQIALADVATAGGNLLAPLKNRQISSDARECHADCGYTIIEASLPGHCTNSTWTDLLEDCLDCALEYEIWKDYQDGVSEAAEGCGLNATPEPPGDVSSSSTSAITSTSLSATATVSTESTTSTETTTSASESTMSTSTSAVSYSEKISSQCDTP